MPVFYPGSASRVAVTLDGFIGRRWSILRLQDGTLVEVANADQKNGWDLEGGAGGGLTPLTAVTVHVATTAPAGPYEVRVPGEGVTSGTFKRYIASPNAAPYRGPTPCPCSGGSS